MAKRTRKKTVARVAPTKAATPFLHGTLAVSLCLAMLPASVAAGAQPRPFEVKLRRSILIKGQEQATYTLVQRMEHYRVPGISVAVIEDCRIVDGRGFGTADGRSAPVTTRTLFQAGSISKVVSAVAALRLVEDGKLSLGADIRPSLRSWTLKTTRNVPEAPVTLRQLLGHTAGLNEVGGRGYDRSAPLPTLTQILEGSSPANTPPIRVETAPGRRWAYSSGSYYVVQALMTDATGNRFPSIIDRLVFRPAAMRDSTFSQPLESSRELQAARAVGPDGSPLAGGWRVNPELAAGGLWSTPSDLARFAIALAKDVRGDSHLLLRASSIRELMTRGPGNWGLGVDLGPPEGPRRLGHTGHNTGFVSEFVMYPDTCQGAVVMTNADQGGGLITEVLRAIGDAYGWPDRRPLPVESAVPLTDAIISRFTGNFRLRDFPAQTFTVSQAPGGNLYWARTGHVGRDLFPQTDGKLFSPDNRMTLEAIGPHGTPAPALELRFGGGKNFADRMR